MPTTSRRCGIAPKIAERPRFPRVVLAAYEGKETVMPGYTKDENSLATGIPNRTISPETGSFGNATVTN
ncbi:hypothetical protein A8F67_14365, partial [Burkholderia cenocepacia]